MKKIQYCLLALLVISFVDKISVSHAFLDSGFSGPMPVYNVDATVDAATIATQVNTLQQLEAALKNLSTMDASAANANMAQIQQELQQLAQLQQQVQGMALNYETTQEQWQNLYGTDYAGMNNADYAAQAKALADQTNRSIYDAMRAQGLVSDIGTDAGNLQQLLNASQSAEGALAAAQAGSQIAALQAQQLMRLQQIMAQSNQAQAAYYEELKQKEMMSRAADEKYFVEPGEPVKGQGPGFPGF